MPVAEPNVVVTVDDAMATLQVLEAMLADETADAVDAEAVMKGLELGVLGSADGWRADDALAVQERVLVVLQAAIARRTACIDALAHQSLGRRASSCYGGQP